MIGKADAYDKNDRIDTHLYHPTLGRAYNKGSRGSQAIAQTRSLNPMAIKRAASLPTARIPIWILPDLPW